MELPIPAIIDQLDVPAVIGLLLVGGYKVLRKLDAMIAGLSGVQNEQARIALELAEHRRHDREDFRLVHDRLDKFASGAN